MKRTQLKNSPRTQKRRTTMAKTMNLKTPNLKKTMQASFAKSSPQSKGKTDSQQFYQRVQEKAYELFERRGYSNGNDLADWFEAERIVRSQSN